MEPSTPLDRGYLGEDDVHRLDDGCGSVQWRSEVLQIPSRLPRTSAGGYCAAASPATRETLINGIGARVRRLWVMSIFTNTWHLVLRWSLYPLRRGVVIFPRGSMRRNARIAAIKFFSRNRSICNGLAEVCPLDRPDLSFEAADSIVIKTVYWFGTHGYEGVLVDVWKSLCRSASNILEIGGNVGFYTVVGGESAKGRYTVLEPLHELAEILRANLRRNELGNVEIVEAAAIAGTEPRTVRLNVPDEGVAAPVSTHLIEGSEISPRSSVRTLTVPGRPFVALVEGRDLIKIDEGVEAELLTTSWEIPTARLPTLVLEILPEAKELAHLVTELARHHGYPIQVVPSYRTDRIMTIAADEFSSLVPARHNSKDIIRSRTPLASAR